MFIFTKRANRFGREDGPTNPNNRKASLLKMSFLRFMLNLRPWYYTVPIIFNNLTYFRYLCSTFSLIYYNILFP